MCKIDPFVNNRRATTVPHNKNFKLKTGKFRDSI